MCPPVRWLGMEEESKGSWAVRCRGPRAPTWASAAEFELASTPAGLHPCFYAGRGMWEWTGFSLHFKKMTLGSMGRRNWNGAGGLEAKRPVRGRFWKSRPQMQVLKTGDKQSKGVRLKTQSWLLDWMQGMREQDLGEQDSDFCSWAGGNAAYWDERALGWVFGHDNGIMPVDDKRTVNIYHALHSASQSLISVIQRLYTYDNFPTISILIPQLRKLKPNSVKAL